MNQDLKFSSDNYKFKCRVSGVLVVDNKLLTVQMNKNGFFCLPGGHVEFGEDSTNAIIREYEEETQIPVNVEKLACITENFFEGKNDKYHEIGFYYILTPKNEVQIKDFVRIEQDKDGDVEHEFKWLDIDNLDNFKPEFLKKQIKNVLNHNNIQHVIIKDNKVVNK